MKNLLNQQLADSLNRRTFLQKTALGLGSMAFGSLLSAEKLRSGTRTGEPVELVPHHPPKAKRVVYLFQSGGPSQLELFDYKPLLNQKHGQELPDSVRQGQRLTGMSAQQSSLPLVRSPYVF